MERDIAQRALDDAVVRRLMTVPGIDMVVAAGLAAAIGDVDRFAAPEKLVAYLGLNPSVRQSGEGPAHHGRISKQGRGQARGMLVEAAWSAARSPGPLRAFFLRIAARRGQHIAAVATARKIAVVVWHMLKRGEDYTWAGRRCTRGSGAASSSRPGVRPGEASPAAPGLQSPRHPRGGEAARRRGRGGVPRLTDGWRPKGPKRVRMGAAKEERQ